MNELPRSLKEHLSPRLIIEHLRRRVNAFGENAERCDIWHSSFVAESIGRDLGILELGPIGLYTEEYTEEIRRETKKLDQEYLDHRTKLNKCKCEKKKQK